MLSPKEILTGPLALQRLVEEIQQFQQECLLNQSHPDKIYQFFVEHLAKLAGTEVVFFVAVNQDHVADSLKKIWYKGNNSYGFDTEQLTEAIKKPFFESLKEYTPQIHKGLSENFPYILMQPLLDGKKIFGIVGFSSKSVISAELSSYLKPFTGCLEIIASQGKKLKIVDREAFKLINQGEEQLQQQIGENMMLREKVGLLEQQIRLLKKKTRAADWEFNFTSRKLVILPHCRQMLGFGESENHFFEKIHPEDLQELSAKNFEVIQHFKVRYQVTKHEERVFEVYTEPSEFLDGQLITISGNLVEVTDEENRLNQQKRQSVTMLRLSHHQDLFNGNLPEFLEVITSELQQVMEAKKVSFWEYQPLNDLLLALRLNKGGEDVYCRGIKLALDEQPGFWDLISKQKFVEVDPLKSPFKENERIFSSQIWNSDQLRGFLFIHYDFKSTPVVDIEFLRSISDLITFAYTAQLKNQIKRQLQTSHEKYRYLFENNPLPMWVYDVKTYNILAVNNAALEEYGYLKEDFLKMSLFDLYPESIHQNLREKLKYSNPGFISDGEWQHIKSDGSVIEVETDSHFIVFEERAARIVLSKNITPRKEAEKNLIKTLNDLKNFQNALNNSAQISFTDYTGNIIEVNDAFCRCSGYHRQELIGQNHRIVKSNYHPAEFYNKMYEHIKRGNYWRSEIKNKSKDGNYYWNDTTISPVFDESGKIYRFMSISYLVTDRKKIEAEKEQLIKDLSNYAFITSHKIRGPLARILGLIQLFNYAGSDTLGNQDLIEKIKSSAEELDQVVNEMNHKLDQHRILSSFL